MEEKDKVCPNEKEIQVGGINEESIEVEGWTRRALEVRAKRKKSKETNFLRDILANVLERFRSLAAYETKIPLYLPMKDLQGESSAMLDAWPTCKHKHSCLFEFHVQQLFRNLAAATCEGFATSPHSGNNADECSMYQETH